MRNLGLKKAEIIGTGSFLPEKIVTNFDLEKIMDTSDEWISQRTGIKERRVVASGMATSDLASFAGQKALDEAGVLATDIDLILVATTTPDQLCPSTACLVQEKLGASKASAFDINAACSGFIYALAVGKSFIESGMYEKILIIGAEALSRFLNPEDRGTAILFGDGAGACLLSASEGRRGILDISLGSDGRGQEDINIKAGGSKNPASLETITDGKHYIAMNGKEVFKFAVRIFEETSLKLLAKNKLEVSDLDFIVPHQANLRILQAVNKRLNLDLEKVYLNLDRYGNMSSASVPVALDEALKKGKIDKGDLVLLVGFGAGLTWGSCLIEF